tara:strand:+ start:3615 stop:8069 length:4455 start_codon:yes stop_codon:yes gene_type:complete
MYVPLDSNPPPSGVLLTRSCSTVWTQTWGFNGNGRLGLAEPGTTDTSQRLTPELIKTLQGAAMKDDADVGMPVDDSQAATKALVKALRPKQIAFLCLGGFHSAALSDQGDVYAWGEGRYGATGVDLSRDEDKEVRKPTRVLGLGGARNNVIVLAAGVKHMLAITEDGKMYSWGDGSCGRLGHGDQTTVSEPRLLSTLKSSRMRACAAGEEHSLAASADGTLFSWGSGSFGKLGHGEPIDESTPRPVASIKHMVVTAVACGYAHSVALCDTYEVLAWGSGWKGKLGLADDTNRLVPTPIPSLKRKHLQQIICGSFHTIALSEGGDIFTWGIGERGQLGHGDLENRKTPTPVLALQGFEIGSIAAGEAHSLASSRDGEKAWGWGAGHYGQLGVGGLEPRLSPTEIVDLQGKKVLRVACGANHSGAVTGSSGGSASGVYMWGNGANSRLGNNESVEQETPQAITALSSGALTESGMSGGSEEPARLLTPEMVRQLQGTDVDAATAQRVLDDTSTLAFRAAQADEAERRAQERRAGMTISEEVAGLKEEFANSDKDDASTMTTVMAVAMAGRAIRPSLDVLQQLVKAQREDVKQIIEEEGRQIETLKNSLDFEVKKNDEIEQQCLEMEDKVKLVLANHKMVHESLARSYGYVRIELWPAEIGMKFEKELYERMVSHLYEEPQYLAALLRRAEPHEVDLLVDIISQRLYSNHYKARDEYLMVQLLMHVLTEDMSQVTDPLQLLGEVGPATKLLSAYTRRGPNTEALKSALHKPMSLVLARKKLELEIEPTRVYASVLEELRFKSDSELKADVTALEAWALPEVRAIIEPRIKNLLDIVELFLTRIISVRGLLPYGIRAVARKIFETAQDRFQKASVAEQMRGVSNFIFVSYFCPAIIQPEAFDLCSPSNKPSTHMKRNLVRIASALKMVGSLTPFDDGSEPWHAELSTLVHNSMELMKQFYSSLCDVLEVDEQRRVTVYMESTESLTPTRTFELNSVYLMHAALYRNYTEVVATSDSPLHHVLLELGNMPDQVSREQNRLVLLRLRLRQRDEHISKGFRGGYEANEGGKDSQTELRRLLLDCLRKAPTVNLRQGQALRESMEDLLEECKKAERYDAAAEASQVLELMELTGTAVEGDASAGDDFLQQTADEIAKQARRRVQMVKERCDLEKIVEYVTNHNDAVRRKCVSYEEYLEAVRNNKVAAKNVYTSEAMQRGGERKKSKKKDADKERKEEDEKKKKEADKIRTVMAESPAFKKIVQEEPGLSKYLDSHPNLTKTQLRDLLDRRPQLVKVFEKHPEELIRIGRAPELRLMLNANKELKAALDKKTEVRELLESNPDMDRVKLNELVFSNAQLKDLYDSRPELKEILQTRAKLFEDEMKELEDQRPEAFVAGPCVRVSCKLLVKEGVIVSVALPPRMVAKIVFELSSTTSGTTRVLALYEGKAALGFDLQLEELLDMQRRRVMVKDLGKLKLDVNKTLAFINDRMRF